MTKNFPAPGPLLLAPSRVWRPFAGGRELDRLAGAPAPADGQFSEEWLLSTVRANNPGRDEPDAGLSFLEGAEDGSGGRISLKDVIESDPAAFLGKAHAARFGAEMGVLVKLIDSRDSLRLQAHPDKALARALFGTEFGKTECWHVLGLRDDGDTPPRLSLGFREGVTREAWRDAFFRQDREAMFGMLHSFRPEVGDTYLIPGGVPHAIGAGCLIAEVQEPSDITIRLERAVPGGPTISDEAMHQGLKFERMFDCFYYQGRSEKETLKAFRLRPGAPVARMGGVIESLVPHAATAEGCFAMERLRLPGGEDMLLRPSEVFSGLYVEEGEFYLTCGGDGLHVGKHWMIFLPPSFDPLIVTNDGSGEGRLLRFYGPALQ